MSREFVKHVLQKYCILNDTLPRRMIGYWHDPICLSVCLPACRVPSGHFLFTCSDTFAADVPFSHNTQRHGQIDDSIMPTEQPESYDHTACVQCDRLKWKLDRNSSFCGMHLSAVLLL